MALPTSKLTKKSGKSLDNLASSQHSIVSNSVPIVGIVVLDRRIRISVIVFFVSIKQAAVCSGSLSVHIQVSHQRSLPDWLLCWTLVEHSKHSNTGPPACTWTQAISDTHSDQTFVNQLQPTLPTPIDWTWWWDNLTPRTIWHLEQFDTDHARRTIRHRGQFDT